MRIILNNHDTIAALDHIRDLIDVTYREHRVLRRRYAEDRDGYPTRSGGEPSSPPTIVDEHGTPMPPRNDPVGELVVGMVDVTGDVGRALATVVRHIAQARRELEGAVGAAREIDRKAKPVPEQAPDAMWCRHHRAHGMMEPLGAKARNGLCRWCGDFNRAEGQLPPTRILDAKARGDRITDQMVAEALGRRAS